MSKKLTVLMVSIDGVGHFNSCIGIAEQLRDRGHKVVFAVPDSWKNKLSLLGFIEEWYNNSGDTKCSNSNSIDVWGDMVMKLAPTFQMSPQEQIKHMMLSIYEESVKQVKQDDPKVKEIIAKVKPDIIIVDTGMYWPSIMNSAIPWVLSFSMQPLSITNENVPPAFSGLPTGVEHKNVWESFSKILKLTIEPIFEDFKIWVKENNGPDLKFSSSFFLNHSPYANIYIYPEELDYIEFRPNPPNFYRFDTFIRNSENDFQIPDFLKKMPGKLVYFSMGTIGCCELEMMKRLITILATSPHRFLVSKGPLAEKIELNDNMWGLDSVPQTKILPLVDLVITHGGNNTVTESFYFGKPLIILPLFGDQHDNAQRVMETGFGLKFHPQKVTEKELLEGIEKLLSDDKLIAKLLDMSSRIQSSNRLSGLAELIESVAKKNIT